MLNKFELTVKAFIGLLETVEETDSGREFRPNYISSCRASDAARMIQLIEGNETTHRGARTMKITIVPGTYVNYVIEIDGATGTHSRKWPTHIVNNAFAETMWGARRKLRKVVEFLKANPDFDNRKTVYESVEI